MEDTGSSGETSITQAQTEVGDDWPMKARLPKIDHYLYDREGNLMFKILDERGQVNSTSVEFMIPGGERRFRQIEKSPGSHGANTIYRWELDE